MLNKCILQGRICKDLELKVTPNGTEVVSFSLAVERNFCKQGEQRQADFINCVAFKHNAKFLNSYFGKGSQVLISGSLQTRTWEDKNGTKHYATEVIADEVNFCGDKSGQAKPQATEEFQEVDTGDDLPFN